MAVNPFTSLHAQPEEQTSPVLSSILNKLPGANPLPTTSVYSDYLTSAPKTFTPTYGEQNMLSQNVLGQQSTNNFNKVLENPLSISVDELLKLHPDVARWSPEVQQKFAQNYRLGTASISDPSKAWEYSMDKDWRPVSDGNKSQITYASDGIKYNSIIDPTKIRWDDIYGLVTDKDNRTAAKEGSTGLIGSVVDQFGSGPLPTLALLASAYFGLPQTGFGGSSAATGASTAAGAGSTAASGVGTFGAAADAALGTGMITSPAGLGSLVGAAPIGSTIPAVAGGFLNPALAGGLAGAASGVAGTGFNTNINNIASGGQQVMDAVPGASDYGLNSLPNAGTMPNTSTPALGAGAGEWTLPSSLTGVPGATVAPSGSTLGAGLALSPGSGLTTAGATAASGGFNVTDYLSDLFGKGADKFMEKPLENSLGLISAISSTSQGKDLADTLKNLMNQGLSQSDPFGSQRAQYAAKLKATYDNPNTYLESPEYKGISRKRLEALERADAAQGRRSQYGARAENMYEFDQENLMKERTLLSQLAGSGIQPSQVSSLLTGLGTGSANAQVNANGQLYALLASMFKGS